MSGLVNEDQKKKKDYSQLRIACHLPNYAFIKYDYFITETALLEYLDLSMLKIIAVPPNLYPYLRSAANKLSCREQLTSLLEVS